jgi:Fe-Mn family superoxide dismutase
MDALAPHLSKETLEYHYGKHHKTYVDKLNGLLEGTSLAKMPLDELLMQINLVEETKRKAVFNNAAQVWNHTFYWHCLSPQGGGEPSGVVAQALSDQFGTWDQFKSEFTQTAINTFGSGWAWLVKQKDGKLALRSTSNAETPLTQGETPLLTCDVWEHAYYIDYRNMRPSYLEAFWKLVNWEFVASRL